MNTDPAVHQIVVFTPARWNKHPGISQLGTPEPAHYVASGCQVMAGAVFAACGVALAGAGWKEWRVHEDLGKVPLCEGCKVSIGAGL